MTTAVTVDAKRVLIAGHRSAITFASQIVKTEQMRNPTDFGDIVRGLQVFWLQGGQARSADHLHRRQPAGNGSQEATMPNSISFARVDQRSGRPRARPRRSLRWVPPKLGPRLCRGV